MKIIVTTSNNYHHLLPIFCYFFNKNWSSDKEVIVVGYDYPSFPLPINFSFVSLGEQDGGPENFSTDLRRYFERQDEWFIWMMEDTFIRNVSWDRIGFLSTLQLDPNVGRINLTKECIKQDHIYIRDTDVGKLYENTQTANYRLSTQPSIWNKEFLLQYLTPNLTPWKFETQKCFNDGWKILGLDSPAVLHNEGVTKKDIFKYNFDHVDEDQIHEMKELGIIS